MFIWTAKVSLLFSELRSLVFSFVFFVFLFELVANSRSVRCFFFFCFQVSFVIRRATDSLLCFSAAHAPLFPSSPSSSPRTENTRLLLLLLLLLVRLRIALSSILRPPSPLLWQPPFSSSHPPYTLILSRGPCTAGARLNHSPSTSLACGLPPPPSRPALCHRRPIGCFDVTWCCAPHPSTLSRRTYKQHTRSFVWNISKPPPHSFRVFPSFFFLSSPCPLYPSLSLSPRQINPTLTPSLSLSLSVTSPPNPSYSTSHPSNPNAVLSPCCHY